MFSIPADNFKILFEQLPGLFLILTPDFTIAAVSDLYVEASLKTREAIIGRNIFDAFPNNPGDPNADGVFNLRASLNYVLQHKKPHAMADQKYDICRPDGVFEERHWSPLNTPVFNEQHEVCYIIHKVQDVTASRIASNQLKKNKRDFQLLVNCVKDYAIFMLDKKGCVTSWNSGAEYIKGYTAAEIMGKPLDIFYTDEDIANGIPKNNLQSALQNGHFETEGWRKRIDGSLFYANIVYTALIDSNGKHYGYAKVTKDITEKRKNEDRLRFLASITNNIQDPVISSDNNFCITRWNDAAEKLFGWKSEEVIGKTTVDVLKTIYLYQPREQVIATIAEKGIWQGELIYHARSGSPISVIVTASKLKDAEGNESGNLILVRNISDRKKAEKALSDLNKELESKIAERTEAIKRSEKQYRNLFANNPMPMWVMDLEAFKFLDVNEMAVLHYGYSREEFLSMTALDIRPDADKNVFIHSDHSNAITANNYNKGIWNHKKKDGSIIQVEIIVHDIIFEGVAARIILANDITERNKAEEKLMASEKRFRALIENNNDIISLMDKSFKVIYRSPSASRITGWTDEDMTGLDGTKNIHPDDREYAAAIVKELMANPGKPVNCKFRNLHKEGHYLWVEGMVVNLLHDKYVDAIVFNFRDVTERIEAEEKLMASEKLYRALIENSDDIITLMDGSFQLVYRSPAAARITGWTNEDMLGVDATRNIYEEDRPMAAAIVQDVMANPRKATTCKFRMWHKQGHYMWVEGVLINLLQDKYVNAIVFNFRNVTERIEAEEKLIVSEKRFRALIENNNDLIVLLDDTFTVVYRSPSATRITGWEDEEITGFSGAKNIHPDDIEKATTLLEDVKANPGKPVYGKFRNMHKDGHYQWMEGVAINLLNDKNVKAIVFNSRDITARVESEEKLIKSEENLKAIFDNAAEGFILADANGIIKAFNNRVVENILLNLQQEIETGTSLFDYIEESRKDFFIAVFSKVINGETIQYDRCYNRTNGETIWINYIFNPVKENNQTVGICISGRDITVEKIAEQQKEFDHSNLHAMINNTGDMVWSVDREFNLITSNHAFNDMIAAAAGHKITKGFKLLNEEFPPDTIKRYKTYYERAFAGATFKEIEYSDTPYDFWSEISFNPIYEGSNVIGTACFSRDITERIKAEEQLRKSFGEKQALAQRMSVILNTLPANIALLNEEGVIVDVNDSWKKFADENQFAGINHGIGNNYIAIAENAAGNEKADGNKVADGLKAVLANKIKEFVYEYPCHSPQKERWFRMVVSPLLEKEYAGAVVMHVDISELRLLEQARLKSSMEEQKKITLAILQGQEKERNYIGKELHDNINQILAGTKLFLTSAGHKNATVKELIQYPVELLTSAIEEIRSLCRNLVSPIKNIDLENLARGLLINFNHTTIIKTDFIYAVPKPLLSDDLKLNVYRILQELVNNTIKYAEAQCITISIKAGRNKLLTVIVADDGKGFDISSKRNGIGISNIMNRVESFDGNLIMESSLGKGCRTTITIPC
ncbi:PAS domain-containing sensor histidine kinase [Ferruginibacter sp. SUN106]|uniref:PAS domain-containing sensor histidine kinase n=1 Tax=Ferruginibacter sp. SUN106 TaxID=2978348 RepID=UPI003D36E0E0